MKRKLNFKIFLLLFICSLTNLNSQTTYEISTEKLNSLNADVLNRNHIFNVELKEVQYFPMIDTLKYSDRYLQVLEDVEKYKTYYIAYLEKRKVDSVRLIKAGKIEKLVNNFLQTKDKKLLDEAHELSLEAGFSYYKKPPSMTENYALYIKNKKKYANKKHLPEYLEYLKADTDKLYMLMNNYYLDSNVKAYFNVKRRADDYPKEGRIFKEKIRSKKPMQKEAFVMGNEVNFSNITGNYQVVQDFVYPITNPDEEYSMNELTKVKISYRSGDTPYVLIQNTNTKKYYVSTVDILSTIQNIGSLESLKSHLESLGYKPYYTSSGYLLVKTKYYTVGNLNVLKEDHTNAKKWLTQLDKNYEELQGLISKSNSYIPKLQKYVQLRNIQRNKMSSADISAWTKVTNEAITIATKMFNLRYENGGVPLNSEPLKELPYTEDFNYYLNSSRNVLGL